MQVRNNSDIRKTDVQIVDVEMRKHGHAAFESIGIAELSTWTRDVISALLCVTNELVAEMRIFQHYIIHHSYFTHNSLLTVKVFWKLVAEM